MTVRSIDGEKLGRVFAVQDGEFLIEKGLFFPKDYVCRYEEISDIRDGEIILLHGKEGLHRFSLGEDRGVLAGTGGGAGVGPGTVGVPAERSTGLGLGADTAGLTANASAAGVERPMVGRDEVAVPVYKEELDVTKRERQAGEVRVHKDVIEEEKELSVPVKRERVRVERRDVKDRPAMHASFQEETVVVPLRAEEVEVRKRAVVDEEVIIRKDAIEEEQRVAETVRHEKVDIRSDGEVEGSRKLDLTPDDPTLRRS
ncbi:YsnF/AvaK domain-containing protein [Hyalangium gracile]|uniref:YsnF/AvaK domain-containing protein n=1 Tax=Hyalangium gracile TaxID=394092 RepID=UPI001CCA1E6B|nr:YsnF/AvaK domain-containing protein [Hyalangium gracile]